MRQTEIVVGLVEGQLLVQAVFPFAQGHHTPPDRGHMLADGEIDPLDEGCVDLPALRGEHLLDGGQGAEHDAMAHADQAPPAVTLTTCA